jgi:hypothetical protein
MKSFYNFFTESDNYNNFKVGDLVIIMTNRSIYGSIDIYKAIGEITEIYQSSNSSIFPVSEPHARIVLKESIDDNIEDYPERAVYIYLKDIIKISDFKGEDIDRVVKILSL